MLRKGLTPMGVAHAWVLGASIYSAFGAGGYLLVCLYFIAGTLVRIQHFFMMRFSALSLGLRVLLPPCCSHACRW